MERTVFHGSDTIIRKPSRRFSRKSCDFGPGFYTNEDFIQAKDWAERAASLSQSDEFYVHEYILNDKGLKTRRFSEPDEEWLQTIIEGRKGNNPPGYDIVEGPIADDNVKKSIAAYEKLTKQATKQYGHTPKFLSRAEQIVEGAIRNLKTRNDFRQVTCITEKAYTSLKLVCIHCYDIKGNEIGKLMPEDLELKKSKGGKADESRL